MSALLAINGLKSFYGISEILHGISLNVQPGEQIAMIGRNGMGKTTLLRSLIGLVDDRRGSVKFHGEEITTQSFFDTKMKYIHLNPVRAGIVEKEEEYQYSSCGDCYGIRKGLLELAAY